jgi:hypothetical protein
VALKAGLPWTSQLELSLPYVYQAIKSITGDSGLDNSSGRPTAALGAGFDSWGTTMIAASPDVSLRTGVSLGAPISGSGQQLANLDLGVSMVLSRNLLFDLSFSVGLTQDAPDFGLGLSLPLRF